MTNLEFDDRLRILTFTTLYPNAAKPQFSVFVENRLRHLVASAEVAARVLAPVPYFPFNSERFGAYAAFARAPRYEERFGIEIDHPRYLTIPKFGMSVAPFLLYARAKRSLARLLREGHRFDLIDAHYFYPDGVAAVMLGRAFGLPVTITARGSDINLIPDYARPRQLILRAARQADGVIAVSGALAAKLVALGVEPSHVTVLRNGVDPQLFRPVTPYDAIERPAPRPLAVSVGNLVPLKGHDLAISALAEIPELSLWIVGGGPERSRLEALAQGLGVGPRVRFLGVVPHERMPEVYSAADVLVLASEREGWPNVLLEAMACGTRVVTTKVSDVADLVNAPAAGIWVEDRSAGSLAGALRKILAAPVPRAQTREHALAFTWDATTRGQIDLFREILHRRGADGR
ncbi:MAG: glycosyltransferase family 4 protein [Kiloniellaceae bacterium]